jgi:transaldolase
LGRHHEFRNLEENLTKDDKTFAGELITEVIESVRNTSPRPMVMASSIRNIDHLRNSVKAGADAITISPDIFYRLIEHKLTNSGIDIFIRDMNKE